MTSGALQPDPDQTTPMPAGGAAAGGAVAAGVHPQVDGFALVMTPPLPPFLEGGFGRVYRATSQDGLLVAIKVLRPDALGPATEACWAQECTLSRGFPSHEHVVRFFPRTVARWPDGRTSEALVMEWLDGARGLIRYAAETGLDKPARIQLLLQAVDGVAWMHTHGTPHCDLKSDNMLVIERMGQPVAKVTDFGGTRVSNRLDGRAAAYSRTRAAPEVVQGDPAAITPRADVYSLCKECAVLVGGTESSDLARADGLTQALGLRDKALEAIVARGMAPEPRDRWQDARELGAALRAYRPPLKERATRALEQWVWPQGRGNPSRFHWVALVLLLAGTVLGWLASSRMSAANIGPLLALEVSASTTASRVLVVREKSADGLLQVAQRLGIQGVDPAAPATKRLVWGAILERLGALGPDAIVMDIAFLNNPDPALNQAILGPIQRVTSGERPVPVIVATQDFAPGRPDRLPERPLVDGLGTSGAGWGCMNLSVFTLFGHAVVIPQREDRVPRLPLSVAAVAAVLGHEGGGMTPLPVQVDERQTRLRFQGQNGAGRSIGLVAAQPATDVEGSDSILGVEPRDLLGIYPVGALPDEAIQPADRDVLDLVNQDGTWAPLDVKGRTVLLAAYRADDVVMLGGRALPGVWMHASVVQGMLDGLSARTATWWVLLPLACAVAVGLAVGSLLLRGVLRGVGVPLPSAGGPWPVIQLPARSAVLRLAVVACGGLGAAALAIGSVLVLGTRQEWVVPYVAGACGVGATTGMLLGGAWAVLVAWMGCVRRAWCLDRPSSTVGAAR